MKNTFKIIGYSETCGDKFFDIAITNKEGETHTDKWSEATVIEAARRLDRKNARFEIAEDEDLMNELSNIMYVEIAEETDSETGKDEFDIYIHKFIVDEDIVELDGEGEYTKTYKSMKAALNYANKRRMIAII